MTGIDLGITDTDIGLVEVLYTCGGGVGVVIGYTVVMAGITDCVV